MTGAVTGAMTGAVIVPGCVAAEAYKYRRRSPKDGQGPITLVMTVNQELLEVICRKA